MRQTLPAAAVLLALSAASCGPAEKAAAPDPGAAAIMAEAPTGPIPLNTPPANVHLVSGWSTPEASGVWSLAPRAVLRLPHPELAAEAVLPVTLEALAYRPAGRGPQRLIASVGVERVGELKLENGGYAPVKLSVPARLLRKGEPLELTLDMPDALSPASVDSSSKDNRLLGVGLKSVTVGS